MKEENKMKLLDKLNTVKPLKETTYKVYNCIVNYGTMTGSRAWDVQTEESDIDIILHPDCYFLNFEIVIREFNGIYLHSIEEIEEDEKRMHYSTTDFESCYVLYEGNIYNLLFMRSEKAYEKWVYATQIMSNCCRSPSFVTAIKNKEFRIKCFENYLRNWENDNRK